MQGEKVLQRITTQFSRNAKYNKICSSAAEQLIVIKKRLAGEPEEAEEDSDDSEE